MLSKQSSKQFSRNLSPPKRNIDPVVYDMFKIIGFTSIPYAVSYIGWWLLRPSKVQNKWMTKVNKSSCLSPSVSSALELITVSPMGVALLLVTKDEFSKQVKTALALFGALMICNLGGIYVFSTVKSVKYWIGASSGIAISSLLTGWAVSKVNRWAGICMLPFEFWMCFQTVELISYHFNRSGS